MSIRNLQIKFTPTTFYQELIDNDYQLYVGNLKKEGHVDPDDLTRAFRWDIKIHPLVSGTHLDLEFPLAEKVTDESTEQYWMGYTLDPMFSRSNDRRNHSPIIPVSSLDILTVPTGQSKSTLGQNLQGLDKTARGSWSAVTAGRVGFINSDVKALPLVFDQSGNILSDLSKPLWVPGQGILKLPIIDRPVPPVTTNAWFALESDPALTIPYVDFSTPMTLTFNSGKMTTVEYADGKWLKPDSIPMPALTTLTPISSEAVGWPPGNAHAQILGQATVTSGGVTSGGVTSGGATSSGVSHL